MIGQGVVSSNRRVVVANPLRLRLAIANDVFLAAVAGVYTRAPNQSNTVYVITPVATRWRRPPAIRASTP